MPCPRIAIQIVVVVIVVVVVVIRGVLVVVVVAIPQQVVESYVVYEYASRVAESASHPMPLRIPKIRTGSSSWFCVLALH